MRGPSDSNLRCVAHGDRSIPYEGTVNAENLIRVMLPSVEMDPEQKRIIEIYRNTTSEWERFRIGKFAVDGRVS